MARGINKVILIGNLGRDPETRYLPSGAAVTNVSVATSESWTDKQTGQKQDRTEWHRVVFFNRLAEIAGEYLKKGSKVYVEGSLRTRKWQDAQSGQDRYSTEIVGSDLQMLDSRGDAAHGGAGMEGYEQLASGPEASGQGFAGGGDVPSSKPAQPPAAGAGGNNGGEAAAFDNSFDDDIPF